MACSISVISGLSSRSPSCIGSVSLFADSVDFLEDASVNFLILVALGWSAIQRARVGIALAGMLLVPGFATLWTAWDKFNVPVPPEPLPLSLAGARRSGDQSGLRFHVGPLPPPAGSLTRAAFLSARNDASPILAAISVRATPTTSPTWPCSCRPVRNAGANNVVNLGAWRTRATSRSRWPW